MIPDFLLNLLKEQYEEGDVARIIDGYSKKRKVTLRINTIKTNAQTVKNELYNNNIDYEEVPWYKEALIIKNASEKDILTLKIYENGEIYLQSLSSMLPPIILLPKENTDILDMAAAPGGKATQIAAITNNKAHITACEMNTIRFERLKYNIQKQGTTCILAMKKDARNLDDFFSFNQILLDAPCSGSGTLYINDPNLNRTFTPKLIEKSIKSQKALVKKAVNLLKSGGEIVYSTCSILEEENEQIIQNVLNNKNVEIIPLTLDNKYNFPLLPTKINGAICVCPTELYEGFFIAKLRKKYGIYNEEIIN